MFAYRRHHLTMILGAAVLAAMALVLTLGPPLLAHDEGGKPHQGHPPLHAQDTMRAFKEDQHQPQSLPALTQTQCTTGSAGGYPCNNIDLLAFMPLSSIGGGSGNDIWGWTDPVTGKEYALMGRTNGTAFVDISDPVNPIYLGNLPPHSANSSWRDIKVYEDHAFMVSEAINSGLQVFDLTQLRNAASPPVTFAESAWYGGFLSAHNLVINEGSGYAYAVGTNNCSGGLHMVDIQVPTSPINTGCYSGDGYTHDAQCVIYNGPDTEHQGKEICLNSNEDTVTIVDVTDKASPVQLSRTTYNGVRYTHQGWLTEDHRYFLVDDELDEYYDSHNTRTYIWDLGDLDNPINIGNYTATTAAIDHNQYIKGNYTFQANYQAGLRILDISDIANANLSEVAYFDIYPSGDSASFNGAWSNYPFFGSGVVVVSGIEQGLFILQPNLSPQAEPSVSIANPADNSTISGSVVVQISASDAQDGTGALTVEWNVDGGSWQPAAYNLTNNFYEAQWDTNTVADGPHTISAQAIDSDLNVSTTANDVIVANIFPAFHIDDITVTAVQERGVHYRGEAVVTVLDEGGGPVEGVALSGTFSGDWSGSRSGTTGANGQVILETPPVKNGSDFSFCVTGANLSGWDYDSAANVEDCDGTGGTGGVGSISGQVTDSSNGLPVPFAFVSTDTGQNTTADGQGTYAITDVPIGDRTVTATADGYASQNQVVTVVNGSDVTANFALEPDATGGTGTIKGTVTDNAGNRLFDVTLTTDTGGSTTTNRGGKYSMNNIPAGQVTVSASMPGFVTQMVTVTVSDGQTVVVDFNLVPQ